MKTPGSQEGQKGRVPHQGQDAGVWVRFCPQRTPKMEPGAPFQFPHIPNRGMLCAVSRISGPENGGPEEDMLHSSCFDTS